MPFEKGNQEAAKGRKVEKMLERILVQEDDKRLRQGLEVVMDLVAKGDKWAIEFITDRLDGKPKTTNDMNHSGTINAGWLTKPE